MSAVLTTAAPPPALAPPTPVGSPPARTLDEPAAALAGTVAEELVVVVAPTTGRFRPLPGLAAVDVGDVVGHVTGGRGRADEVRSPVRAVLRSLLVRPGQLVMRGQGLVWMGRA